MGRSVPTCDSTEACEMPRMFRPMFESWTCRPMVFREGRHRAYGSDRKDPETRWEGIQESRVSRSLPQLDPCEKEPRLHSNHRIMVTVCNSPSLAVRAIEANVCGLTPLIYRKIARGYTIKNKTKQRIGPWRDERTQIESRREKKRNETTKTRTRSFTNKNKHTLSDRNLVGTH